LFIALVNVNHFFYMEAMAVVRERMLDSRSHLHRLPVE
jgi:hypothetical protein